MANERAGKVDCTISWPMRKQRDRLRPGSVGEWEKFLSLLSWQQGKVGHVYVNMLNTGK